MKTGNALTRIIMLFVIVAILSCFFITVASAKNEDYSKPGASSTVTYSAADVLRLALGIEMCEAEEKYLELYGEYSLTYGNLLPSSLVSVSYVDETGALSVIARRYSYVAQNGTEVEFLPIRVTLSDRTVVPVSLDSDSFVADFGTVSGASAESVEVTYSTLFTVTERTLNSLVSKAYYDAVSWKQTLVRKEKEYHELLSKYESDKATHELYLVALAEYESDLILYKAYRTEKRLYDEKMKLYSTYLEARADYEAKLKVYSEYEEALKKYNEEYAKYKQYLVDKEQYEEDLSLYNKYVEKIAQVKSQISIIDGLKSTSTSLDRSVYNAIIGDTVTQVILNKDAIANNTVGVKPETVDMAGLATERLRTLFDGYYSLEDEKDKYTYYVINYESFKTAFVDLLRSLDKMYENSKVRLALDEKGIKGKYEILLAQLYYVVNALCDGPVANYDGSAFFDSSYKVNRLSGASPLEVLEGAPYMPDTEAAAPLSDGYPHEVIPPVLEEMEEPVRPKQVTRPTEPEPVEDPGLPPIERIEPIPPAFVSDPGDSPLPYLPPEGITELISAYDSGLLGRGPRADVVGSRSITVDLSLKKKIVGAETFRVDFMSAEGELICTAYADKNTYAEYSGPIPTKQEDAEATYTFDGWMEADLTRVDITSIERNLILYPSFRKDIKEYEVRWNVDGKIYKSLWKYGELPSYEGSLLKDDVGSFEYIFKGWDKVVSPVTESVEYTAVYASEPLYRAQNGNGVPVTLENDDFIIDCTAQADSVFNISKIIPRAAERGAIVIKTQRYNLTASYSDVILMESLGVSSVAVSIRMLPGGEGYRIRIDLLDSRGEPIADYSRISFVGVSEVKISFDMPLSFSDPDNLRFYVYDGAFKTPVSSSYKNERLTASCRCGVDYFASVEYDIHLIEQSDIDVSLSLSSAAKGELIYVTLGDVPKGITLNGVYLIDSSGKRTEIVGGRFEMPTGGASVDVDYSYTKYKITFVADGRTISSSYYLYGQTVAVPGAPEKATDDKYSYKFVGWSPSISDVTGECVYTAKYMQVKLPEKPPADGLQITDGVLRIIVAIGMVGFYALGVFIPVAVIAIVKAVLIKRRKRPRK